GRERGIVGKGEGNCWEGRGELLGRERGIVWEGQREAACPLAPFWGERERVRGEMETTTPP
ncbi:MAG: hypothetical protein KGZ54_02135, partial [Dethiobacter sp.]|nr:hypothetical protein [Dethiobacter sp.]MBS3900810.1 hypothetical protein [Dethiobacter sp.]